MDSSVTRLQVGGFLMPESIAPGERVVVNAWVVRHPEATILVDTGLAEGLPADDVEQLRILRRPIADALADAGLTVGDVDLVINCHLHADHAGGNHEFRGTPILVQPDELAAAREPEYSVPEALDLEAGRYEQRSGEHEPLPGIRIVPTPGHSPGHQAVLVDTPDGRLLLAGQIYRQASDFARAVTALRLQGEGYADAPSFPEWLPRLMDLDPWRVAFGHDTAVWQRDA